MVGRGDPDRGVPWSFCLEVYTLRTWRRETREEAEEQRDFFFFFFFALNQEIGRKVNKELGGGETQEMRPGIQLNTGRRVPPVSNLRGGAVSPS